MQCSSFEAFALQRPRQATTTELAVHKNKGLLDTALIEHSLDHAAFVVVLGRIKTLLDGRGGLIGTSHLDGDGVLQVAACQALDFGREGGRKQERGALLGQETQDAL